ncbi:hypothetical protein [Malaciobacter mytili]|uniref:Uncharacterized protein n=1 Tax=Malaciobacter mytili LMG 24559 TaxID=1032238 RepID=A0AAX2AJ62_9BACT|nr:hypothetical protein [Malaciobacter mytili]AXH14728.1 putative membrane protein [Malaciobacter mytili LMG 24559]RXI48330.1 hypothetical protein CRU99_01435 [Malaciobacter mytili]RXK16898.1 hypothetical protein CP985_01705 [Malaciobacter mytili LMG 24559]
MKKKNEKVKLERVYEKAIKIFGKQLKITRVILIFSALLLYFIALYYETKNTTLIFLGIIPFAALILSIILLQKKILYFGEYSFECSNAGDVYLTKLKGNCPICKGELKIANSEYIQCQKNKEHKFFLYEN